MLEKRYNFACLILKGGRREFLFNILKRRIPISYFKNRLISIAVNEPKYLKILVMLYYFDSLQYMSLLSSSY